MLNINQSCKKHANHSFKEHGNHSFEGPGNNTETTERPDAGTVHAGGVRRLLCSRTGHPRARARARGHGAPAAGRVGIIPIARGPQQPRGFPVQGQGAGLTRGKSRTAMPSWAAYSRTGSRTMSRPGHLCRHDVVAHDVGIEAQYVLCISHVFGTCYLL